MFKLEDRLTYQDVQSLLCVIDLMRKDITYRYMDNRYAEFGLGRFTPTIFTPMFRTNKKLMTLAVTL